MPGRTLPADAAAVQDQISAHISRILDQAQVTTTNHQKNFVSLYKVQTKAAEYTEVLKTGKGYKLTGERIFEEALIQTLTRVLPLKKGVTQADRIVKFVGQYIKFVNEKAAEERKSDGTEETDEEETTAARFTIRLLRFLLRGFSAKDKSVRYRVLQTVAEMVSHLGAVDEDIYQELRSSLLNRTTDREVPVRVQAVIALVRLSGSEDPSDLADGEQTVLDVIVDTLEHDSSPEVRRTALLNIPVNSTTIPKILDRTRDTDTVLRKHVYSSVLEGNVTVPKTDNMGPTHPRALTIAQRELIIRNGLGDREPSVQNSAASLLGKWVDVIAEHIAKPEDGDPADAKVESGLVNLLKLLDLAENKVATDAIQSVFVSRSQIFDKLEFNTHYWENLTPETAFLARVFVDYCKANNEPRLDTALPVVTELAFRIQTAYNDLVEYLAEIEEERLLQNLSEEDNIRFEEARLERETILGELLQLAVNLDYSDEIGRRKMFQLVRDMLSQDILPESLLAKCLDVLRMLCDNERDLIRVVVEIVQDLRAHVRGEDGEEDETKDADAENAFDETPTIERSSRPLKEHTAEEKQREDAVDFKCLILCIGMLERVNSTLEDNSTLDGILQQLIIPSVKRKELMFRQKGLISLGLCCLIAKRLAFNSILLFVKQLSTSPDILKESLLQIVFDVLMVHEQAMRNEQPEYIPNILPELLKLLAQDTSDRVRALVCTGISKLILSGVVRDDMILVNLIRTYLSPATVDNQELRQCLTFFFQAYCYSSSINQKTIRQQFLKTYKELKNDRMNLEDDEEMISSAQVAALFVDWTDPTKLRSVVNAQEKSSRITEEDMSVHLDLGIDIINDLLRETWEKEDKKIFCQLLGKLYIPDAVDDDKIKHLKLLMHGLRSRRPLRDATTNNAFTKFETAILKKFEKQLEDFSEEEYRKLEQLEGLFQFLDSIIPDDDEEVISLDEVKKQGRKRRSNSIATTTTEGEELDSPPSPKRARSKGKSKRPRLSRSDDDDSDHEVIELTTPPPPTRVLPKRSATTKPIQVIEISSDSDEELATPIPRPKRSKQRSIEVKEEEELDADIDKLLDDRDSSEIPFDSLFDDGDQRDEDTQDEDEEEEVNDLLADDD